MSLYIVCFSRTEYDELTVYGTREDAFRKATEWLSGDAEDQGWVLDEVLGPFVNAKENNA